MEYPPIMLSLVSLALAASIGSPGPWLVTLNRSALQEVRAEGQPTRWIGQVRVPGEFTEAVLSYRLANVVGTGIRVFARPKVEGAALLQLADYQPGGIMTSVRGQKDAFADVDTDTLSLAQPVSELEVVVEPTPAADGTMPHLKDIHVSLIDAKAAWTPRKGNAAPWGKTLEPPRRAQSAYVGGNVLCSPTAVSMGLGFWAKTLRRPELDCDVPEVQRGVFDAAYDGTGNWSFNMAFAASQSGIKAYVSRFRDVRDLEDWVDSGVPVACSVSYGLLRGKDKRESDDGHLVLLVGFDRDGNPVFNDPGRNVVRLTYQRADFERAWATSRRTVYLIYPEGWKVPAGEGPWEHDQ